MTKGMKKYNTVAYSQAFKQLYEMNPEVTEKAFDWFYNRLEKSVLTHGYEKTLRTLYDFIDKCIAEDKADSKANLSKATCTKGCNACCHARVDASYSEARLLWEERKNEILKNKGKIKRLVGVSDKDRWNLPKSEKACIFLKNGECSVYSIRPGGCRRYHVVSSPKMCDGPVNSPVLATFSIQAEIASTAFNGVDKVVGPKNGITSLEEWFNFFMNEN